MVIFSSFIIVQGCESHHDPCPQWRPSSIVVRYFFPKFPFKPDGLAGFSTFASNSLLLGGVPYRYHSVQVR
jgi:hypothetical protein